MQMTETDVLNKLREAVRRAGGQNAFARRFGVTQSNISLTLTGKVSPTPAILRAIGIERRMVYRRAEKTTR
jgi:DNA-binding transcriptional regulator YdaS (Cro superfamily)